MEWTDDAALQQGYKRHARRARRVGIPGGAQGSMPLTLLDIGLLVVMLISGILAMVRGFMREILSIAAWLIAAIVTLYGYARAEVYVREYVTNDLLAKAIAIGGLFLLTLLIVSLFTVKISDLVLDSRVGALDRSLGFLFGLARGLVIMVVAFLFFAWLVPAKSQPDWVTGARSRVVLQATGDWLLSILPDDPETAILKRLRPPRGGEEPIDATRPTPAPPPAGPVQTVPGQKSERGNSPSQLAETDGGETAYKRRDRQGFDQLLEGARGAPR
jgi:membrane protein required for colicin V production